MSSYPRQRQGTGFVIREIAAALMGRRGRCDRDVLIDKATEAVLDDRRRTVQTVREAMASKVDRAMAYHAPDSSTGVPFAERHGPEYVMTLIPETGKTGHKVKEAHEVVMRRAKGGWSQLRAARNSARFYEPHFPTADFEEDLADPDGELEVAEKKPISHINRRSKAS